MGVLAVVDNRVRAKFHRQRFMS